MLALLSPRSKIRRASAFPREFWVMFTGQIINRLGQMVVLFFVFHLTDLGFSPSTAGVVLMVVGAGGILGGLAGGTLADRFGVRRTVVVSLLGSAATFALLAVARGLPTIVLTSLLVGIASEIYPPAVLGLIASTVRPEKRMRAFGLMHWARNLGISIAGIMGGVLIEHGYALLCAADAGTCMLFAVIVAVGISSDQPRTGVVDRRSRRYSGVLRDKLLLAITLLVLLHATTLIMGKICIPLAVRDDDLAPSTYGAVVATNCILIVLFQPILTTLLSRWRKPLVLAVAWTVYGGGLALTGLANSTFQYLLTTVVWTLGEIGRSGVDTAVVADLSPGDAHGRYQAVYGWAWTTAGLTGPAMGSALYTTTGQVTVWWTCACLGAIGGIGVLLLSPALNKAAARQRRRTACATS